MSIKRLLVAEPNPAVRTLLSLVFDPGLHRLDFVSDGEETLGAAIVDPPDLVVVEVRLGRLDGVSLCEQLKRDPRTAGSKVLFLTTAASELDMRRARRAGADGYLTKPFSPRTLLREVDRLLESPHAPALPLTREARDSRS